MENYASTPTEATRVAALIVDPANKCANAYWQAKSRWILVTNTGYTQAAHKLAAALGIHALRAMQPAFPS